MRAHFSFAATAFDGIDFSGNAIVVGDAAIIEKLGLPIPLPDRLVNLLVRFLDPNQGRLSQRARSQEFAALTDEKVVQVEALKCLISHGYPFLNIDHNSLLAK